MKQKKVFTIPAWLEKMVTNNWLGDKTGQGFFKKTRSKSGETEILTLNLNTMEYGPRQKVQNSPRWKRLNPLMI